MYGGLKEKNIPKKHGKPQYTPPQSGMAFKKQVPESAQGAPYPKRVGKEPYRADKGQSAMHVEKSVGQTSDELKVHNDKKPYRTSSKQKRYDVGEK